MWEEQTWKDKVGVGGEQTTLWKVWEKITEVVKAEREKDFPAADGEFLEKSQTFQMKKSHGAAAIKPLI